MQLLHQLAMARRQLGKHRVWESRQVEPKEQVPSSSGFSKWEDETVEQGDTVRAVLRWWLSSCVKHRISLAPGSPSQANGVDLEFEWLRDPWLSAIDAGD